MTTEEKPQITEARDKPNQWRKKTAEEKPLQNGKTVESTAETDLHENGYKPENRSQKHTNEERRQLYAQHFESKLHPAPAQ